MRADIIKQYLANKRRSVTFGVEYEKECRGDGYVLQELPPGELLIEIDNKEVYDFSDAHSDVALRGPAHGASGGYGRLKIGTGIFSIKLGKNNMDFGVFNACARWRNRVTLDVLEVQGSAFVDIEDTQVVNIDIHSTDKVEMYLFDLEGSPDIKIDYNGKEIYSEGIFKDTRVGYVTYKDEVCKIDRYSNMFNFGIGNENNLEECLFMIEAEVDNEKILRELGVHEVKNQCFYLDKSGTIKVVKGDPVWIPGYLDF